MEELKTDVVLVPVVEKVKPWKSKTQWAALIIALVGFIPGVADLVQDNPQATLLITGAIFSILRIVTKGKVTLK